MFMLLRTLLLFLLLSALPTAQAVAQDGITRKQAEKNLARKAKEERKAKARKVKEDRKRHLEIQDKATRKRIKRHTRRADKRGSGRHRDGFLRRTFGG
jgi:Flp pilus assembly protein TadB